MTDEEMLECYNILKDREEDFETKLDELLKGFPEDIQEDFINLSLKNNSKGIEILYSQRKIFQARQRKLQATNEIN